ncbi:MAG: DUF362 domain-containing protein, partial [Thermoproteota archaeon]
MSQKGQRVVLSKIQGSLKDTLHESLNSLNLGNLKGEILVKPNVCMPEYLPGAVTNPSLLYNLITLLRDEAERVTVVESDGYNYSCSWALRNTGIKKAAEEAGGRVINLSHEEVVQVNFKDSPVKRLFLPKILLEADALVDMPVMKTHEFTTYGGAIKNLFGCLPNNRRIFLHPYLSEVLFRLLTLLKPELTVMDATVAMEGRGPTRGSPVKLDVILTGKNTLAVDVTATKIMKLDWRAVDHLKYIAQRTGFEENNLQIIGASPSQISRSFVLPTADLPMRSQFKIFKYPWLTKLSFCSPKLV